MSVKTVTYHSVIWTGDNHDDPQFTSTVPDHVQPEELHHNLRLLGTSPFVLPVELDPLVAGYLNWSDENTMKSAREVPGPQSELQRWDGIALPNEHRGFEMMHESPLSEYSALIHPLGYHELSDEPLLPSQRAAERALFMTPSFHPPSFPTFSASPVSDPCGSPEMTPSSRWDAGHDRGELPSPQTSPAHSQIPDIGFLTSTKDEDSMTTLEMPDGSTRLSSNWLPVDPTAGFTIGPNSSRMYPGRGTLEVEGFHDIREAFFDSS